MTNVMVDNPAVKGDGGKADKAPSPNQAETNTATKPTATPLKAPASSSTDPQEKPDTTPRLPTALTPDGQGTVVDNVTDQDSKEFFTFTTPSNNTFYLVIDKQRDSENVYFLNAVTESDLLALAEKVRTILAAYPADDPAVAALKVSPAYRKVANLIEGDNA